MFTGDLDSTAALYKLLSQDGDELRVHHVHMINREGRARAESDASAAVIEWCRANCRPFRYSESTIDFSGLQAIPIDYVTIAYAACHVAIDTPGCNRIAVGTLAAGSFLKPTVIETGHPGSAIATTEIFGPVLAVSPQATLDDAIAAVNRSAFGNMACIFTSSGAAARKFRYEARAGNIGVNIGVAAPMAFFPFSGWKGSFFGDLHAQGHDAVDFYTDKKVVVERWPKEWSRTF